MSPGASPSEEALTAAYVNAEKEEETGYKSYRDVLASAAAKASRTFGADLSPEKASAFAASLPSWPAFKDSAPSLRELRRMGYSLHILSNVDTVQLQETVRRSSLEVDGFVTAEMTKSYKPAPGHWKTFMSTSGARADQILHAAQSVYHDIIPARALGISTAWVNRYGEADSGVKADYVVKSLGELVGVVAGTG